MSRWGLTSLSGWPANVPLLLGGLRVRPGPRPGERGRARLDRLAVHGLAGAGVVVARMMGMLVGISALTTIGLRRYYAERPASRRPCRCVAAHTTRCDAFDHLLREAGIAQEHTVFAGAAVLRGRRGGARRWCSSAARETRALPSRPWVDP